MFYDSWKNDSKNGIRSRLAWSLLPVKLYIGGWIWLRNFWEIEWVAPNGKWTKRHRVDAYGLDRIVYSVKMRKAAEEAARSGLQKYDDRPVFTVIKGGRKNR